MSTVEAQGFPKTGRRGISAALRAERWSAPRREPVFSGSVAKSQPPGRMLGNRSTGVRQLLGTRGVIAPRAIRPVARRRLAALARIAPAADTETSAPRPGSMMAACDEASVAGVISTRASADTTSATPRAPRRRGGGRVPSTRGGRGSGCRRCRGGPRGLAQAGRCFASWLTPNGRASGGPAAPPGQPRALRH